MTKQSTIINPNTAKDDGVKLWEVIKQFLHDNKPVKVTVELNEETRRVKQNRILFLWHSELSKHILESTGNTFSVEEIHEWVAEKLLPKNVVAINNEPIIVRTKTSKLTVKEFSQFLSHYEWFASDTYDCAFPRPDDLYLDALMRNE